MKWWYPLCVIVLVTVNGNVIVNAMPSADEDSPVSQELETLEDAASPSHAAAGLPSAQGDSESDDDLETSDFSEEEIGASGNWIKKKDLLLKAYALADEIRSLSSQIQSSRQTFNEKYHTIDNDLDNFYKELGLEQGKLQELFSSISHYLENKKNTKQEELQQQKDAQTLKDRDFIINIETIEEEIKKHTKSLDQLKLDMKSIEELDKSLTERLKKLDAQIHQTTTIEREAKTKIDKLWNILDHKKARNVYYDLKGKDLEKLKAIQEYVQNDLLQDFDKVSSTIKTQMAKIKEQIAILEKQGFFIKDRAKKLKEFKTEQAAKEAQEKEKSKPHLTRRTTTSKPQAWYTRWYDSLTSSAAKGYTAVKNVFSLAAKKQKLSSQLPATPTPTAPTNPTNHIPEKQPISNPSPTGMPAA